MAGWIKLPTKITDIWIWQDEERLRWWLDLLFLASSEDRMSLHDTHRFILRKGQIIASVSFLSTRWGKSCPTVIKYLKLLEREGLVSRKVLFRRTAIISICNYDQYHTIDEQIADASPDIKDTIIEIDNDNADADNLDVECNNSTSISPTYESKNLDFIEEMKQSQTWLEQMAMRYHLTIENVVHELNRFALDLNCRGTEHRYFNDAKRHFNDWLRIQLKFEKDATDRKNSKNKRRGTDVTASSAEDYKGAF